MTWVMLMPLQRIIIIDQGKMIYDDNIAHLKTFRAYRTIKITLPNEQFDGADEEKKAKFIVTLLLK